LAAWADLRLLIYDMYSMLNVVTEAEGFPAAVLFRAIEPLEGIEMMAARRPAAHRTTQLTNGPGKLCRPWTSTKTCINWDVSLGQKLWLEPDEPVPDTRVATGPRVGVDFARPEDRRRPWRFWISGNPFVSR